MTSRNPRSVWGRLYDGLPIKSDYRVHEVVCAALESRCAAATSLTVLDIATGTGALAKRLADRFPSWTVEINSFEDDARVAGFRKHRVDLNEDFAERFDASGYDLIVAVEIIEHLENPWHFLREIRKLLRKGGMLVVSTPNVDSTLDRLTYLVLGHPYYFGERGYANSGGHITPVPDWLFRRIAASSGYAHVELNGAVDTGPLTGLKSRLAISLLRFLMRDSNDRSISVYLCD